MQKILTTSILDTEALAKSWLGSLQADETQATVVGLYGNLGAGKTTFSQSVGKALEIKETMTSPTFVIEKIYETAHPIFKRLIHIDAYRLESGAELQVLNFEELVSNKNNLILIEWPENIKSILPEDHIKVYCEFVDDNTRQFSF